MQLSGGVPGSGGRRAEHRDEEAEKVNLISDLTSCIY